jgi:hypothetical protein
MKGFNINLANLENTPNEVTKGNLPRLLDFPIIMDVI